MMIKKSSLIARMKLKRTLLLLAIFICFAVVFFLIPYAIPICAFTLYTFIMEFINHNFYNNLKREEEERENKVIDENDNLLRSEDKK